LVCQRLQSVEIGVLRWPRALQVEHRFPCQQQTRAPLLAASQSAVFR